jgi:hypothetical protein
MPAVLSAAELEHFRTQGHLVAKGVIPREAGRKR